MARRRAAAQASVVSYGVPMADPREAQLIEWIARTRATQRKLRFVIAALVVVAIALGAWRRELGVLGAIVTAIVGISGFWITSSHITDWRQRLDHLRRAPAVSPVAGGGRRF